MAKILKPVLRLLESLYRFPGGQAGAPTEVQLGLGVTPVHDLSRMAELGNAKILRDSGGYWLASLQTVHVATGSLTVDLNFVTPGSAGEGYIYNPAVEWIWVIDLWGISNDATDFSEAVVSFNPIGSDFFVGPSVGVPASVRGSIVRYTAGIGSGPLIGIPQARLPQLVLSPEDGVRLLSIADTAGTVTVTVNLLLWIGLRNTYPPGVY